MFRLGPAAAFGGAFAQYFHPAIPDLRSLSQNATLASNQTVPERTMATSKKVMYGRSLNAEMTTPCQSFGRTHMRQAVGSPARASNQPGGLRSSVPGTAGPK